jgi:hypothetical protein
MMRPIVILEFDFFAVGIRLFGWCCRFCLSPVGNLRAHLPSDISREQFEAIKPLLESARRKTSPRRIDLYEVFCAVLYLLRSGCQWRMLPEEFPKWHTVHSYFAIWSEPREGGSSARAG